MLLTFLAIPFRLRRSRENEHISFVLFLDSLSKKSFFWEQNEPSLWREERSYVNNVGNIWSCLWRKVSCIIDTCTVFEVKRKKESVRTESEHGTQCAADKTAKKTVDRAVTVRTLAFDWKLIVKFEQNMRKQRRHRQQTWTNVGWWQPLTHRARCLKVWRPDMSLIASNRIRKSCGWPTGSQRYDFRYVKYWTWRCHTSTPPLPTSERESKNNTK